MQEKKLKRIGVIGGSFDPIHTGHLVIAEHVVDMLQLDAALFIPCNLPPHKDARGLTPAQHRLRMVELAVQHNARFRASDMEIKRGGVSYSVDTIKQLILVYGQHTDLYFIIGADSLKELPTWKNYKVLLSLCTIVTAARPGFALNEIAFANGVLSPEESNAIKEYIVPTPLIDVSSTDIRRRCREGRSIRYLVPSPVEEYIDKNRLYASKAAVQDRSKGIVEADGQDG